MSAPVLTLFTTPKPFQGHIGIIQRNALRSWSQLPGRPEVIVFGGEDGTAKAAGEAGARHVADVARSEHGTPLVSDLFAQAERLSAGSLLTYVNADIILLPDFVEAVGRVAARRQRFLMVGARWDVDVTEPLEFSAGWEQRLRGEVRARGKLHGPTGIDYLVFPRGTWGQIPPFAIGRTVWDNWLLYQARVRRAPLVDATRVVLAVHQNHDYSHISGDIDGAWKGPEAQRNLALAGGYAHTRTIVDSNWMLGRRWLLPAVGYYPRRMLATFWRFVRYQLWRAGA